MHRKVTLLLDFHDSPANNPLELRNLSQKAKTYTFFHNLTVDENIKTHYPMMFKDMQDGPPKSHNQEIRLLRTEIDDDILSAKGNKNYAYMRNHKYFKD